MKPVTSSTSSSTATVSATAPSSSPSASAIIANAKMQVTVSSEPAPPPTAEPVQDRFDSATAAARPQNSELNEKRSEGANPFRDLDRDSQTGDLRLSATTVDLGTTIDPTHEQQARLAAFMAGLASRQREVPTKTLDGFLMLAHDGQGHLSQSEQQHLTAYTRSLVSNQTTQGEHRSFWKQVGANQQNVAALVQRVLRESYMISTELMRDMTDSLKRANELRKQIREELEQARKVKSAWATEAKGDENWLADGGYRAQRVNHDAFRLDPDVMSQEEAESEAAAVAARASGGAADGAATAFEGLDGESRLGGSEIYTLGRVLRGDDNDVKDQLDAIIATLPSMNAADLRKYIEPFLDKLNGGNTDEDEIKRLFEAMSPEQFLTVIADGYTATKFGFGNDDAEDFANLTIGTLMEQLTPDERVQLQATIDAQLAEYDRKVAESREQGSAPRPSDYGQITRDLAKQYLEAGRQKAHPETTPADGEGAAPQAGGQRMMRTVEALEGYIKALEEDLNSVGEDAQLMNMDLQNELQRAQQNMQLMSNMSKVVHDTAMAVIRNTNS